MNYRKLSDNDLMNLINTSNDTKILADAEDEYVRRYTESNSARWEITEDDVDEEIMKEINKTWRAR